MPFNLFISSLYMLYFIILLSLDNDVLESSKRRAVFYNILSQNFIVKCSTKSLLIRIFHSIGLCFIAARSYNCPSNVSNHHKNSKYSELLISVWHITGHNFIANEGPLQISFTSSYPTVVMEIKDHQNPSQDPLMNERGNSSLFQ